MVERITAGISDNSDRFKSIENKRERKESQIGCNKYQGKISNYTRYSERTLLDATCNNLITRRSPVLNTSDARWFPKQSLLSFIVL